MSPEPAPGTLLVFDFDGVLVDGMPEYWWAARTAARRLLPSLQLPEAIPADFTSLRPHIHKGWEMVLVAAELGSDSPFAAADPPRTAAAYQAALEPALQRRGWTQQQLQSTLEAVRREALEQDLPSWLARHRFYPGVIERLGRLAAEGADWGVLTTKGGAFAARLLAAAGLQPLFLYGHEQGSKPEVLLNLSLNQQGRPLWFIEDRRPTLELVRSTAGLEAVRCFLVSWGYLGADDSLGLPEAGLHWLTPDRFAAPLANWQ